MNNLFNKNIPGNPVILILSCMWTAFSIIGGAGYGIARAFSGQSFIDVFIVLLTLPAQISTWLLKMLLGPFGGIFSNPFVGMFVYALCTIIFSYCIISVVWNALRLVKNLPE